MTKRLRMIESFYHIDVNYSTSVFYHLQPLAYQAAIVSFQTGSHQFWWQISRFLRTILAIKLCTHVSKGGNSRNFTNASLLPDRYKYNYQFYITTTPIQHLIIWVMQSECPPIFLVSVHWYKLVMVVMLVIQNQHWLSVQVLQTGPLFQFALIFKNCYRMWWT